MLSFTGYIMLLTNLYFMLQQKFLENELDNNQEKEKKVGAAERFAAKLRLEYQDAEKNRIQFQDEVYFFN